jgi:preprotein translocase subunit SecA
MLESLLKSVFGSKHERDLVRIRPIVAEINRLAEGFQGLSDQELRAKTPEWKARLAEAVTLETEPEQKKGAEKEALDDLLPEARRGQEACRRLVGQTWEVVSIPITWDMIPYDVS